MGCPRRSSTPGSVLDIETEVHPQNVVTSRATFLVVENKPFRVSMTFVESEPAGVTIPMILG